MIFSNHFIKETSYESFCSEWKEYNKDFDSIINQISNSCYLLMSYNLTNDIEGSINRLLNDCRLSRVIKK